MPYLPVEEKRNNEKLKTDMSRYVSQSIKHDFCLETFLKYCPEKKSKVLDCGTASGAFIQQLLEAGYQNISAADLQNCLDPKIKVQEFKSADFSTEKLPFADNSFDAVTAWCVIPHLENPYHFTREVYRILKKGGIFIMSLPHIGSASNRKYFYKMGELVSYKEKNSHITVWSPAIFQKTVLRNFSLIGTEYLVKNKTYKGIIGKFRKLFSEFARDFLGKRWGAKIAYIVKK